MSLRKKRMSGKKGKEKKKKEDKVSPSDFSDTALVEAEVREKNRRMEEARKRDIQARKEYAGQHHRRFSCAACFGCSDPNTKLEDARKQERRRMRRRRARAGTVDEYYSYSLTDSEPELQDLDCCTACMIDRQSRVEWRKSYRAQQAAKAARKRDRERKVYGSKAYNPDTAISLEDADKISFGAARRRGKSSRSRSSSYSSFTTDATTADSTTYS